MPLTGLQIYSHLPKTNCAKCGFPTCLAFAMALVQGRVAPEQCPDIAEEARILLTEATKPPMRTVQFGLSRNKLSIGGEVVLFRHEKTFFHPPPFAVLLSDTMPQEAFRKRVKAMENMEFDLVGNTFRIDMLAIRNDSQDTDTFVHRVRLAGHMPLVLISDRLDAVRRARDVIGEQTPVVFGGSTEEWIRFAVGSGAILVIKGNDPDDLAVKSEHAQSLGLTDIVLCPAVRSVKEALITFTRSRQLALEEQVRSLGFPLLGWAGGDVLTAAHFICKYAGIIVLETTGYEELLPLFTLRLNIYSDPRHPPLVEPGLYEAGNPGMDAPVLVTTNASLTFHMVYPEIEDAQIPSYLLVTDSEGLSVLSAWAADKFNADIIIRAIRDSGMERRVKHRKIIIPGAAASLRAGLEERSGWEALVGPQESNMIPHYLKMHWKSDGNLKS